MLGTVCATTVAAIIGVNIRIPSSLRWIMLSVLGITLALAVLFSLPMEAATGPPFAEPLLALAPGGLAEISLTRLSLNIDAAPLSTHQVVRILFIVPLFPLAFRFVAGTPGQR